VRGFDRLGPEVGPEQVGLLRAAVFAMWLVEVVPDPLSFWGELPPSMHEPIGLFKLVPGERWEQLLTIPRFSSG
jgi:hypothetical protein